MATKTKPIGYLYESEGFADAWSKRRLPMHKLLGNPRETALYAADAMPARYVTDTMTTSTKRSQSLRARRKADGLQEVRGIWADPKWHDMLKEKAQSLVRGWSRAVK